MTDVKLLRENYEKACVDYLVALLNAWEWDCHYGFWIGDKVGGTYCYGDDVSMTMDEITFCVDNGISEKQHYKYFSYCMRCAEYEFSVPNIESYFNGCPHVPDETFDKLDRMKAEMINLINETKENF